MQFHENVTCLVSCFEGSLVPASMENIREFKNVLRNLVPEKVADFSAALTKAFNLLKEVSKTEAVHFHMFAETWVVWFKKYFGGQYQKKENAGGARCNQAIMLITDEAPQMYEDIFKFYNQPERRVGSKHISS